MSPDYKPLDVLAVFGTRPEAIKLAPVVRELQRRARMVANGVAGAIRVKVCVTAQHRDMLDQVLSLFEIVPDYDLNVMVDSQTPTQVAASVMARLEPVFIAERPDWVLVQGDTTTAAIAALAAFYSGIRIGHVEAGLRTWDKWRPFPEEINRRVAGLVADLHFAPTELARQNLLREGVSEEHVVVTGNPVIDALRWVAGGPKVSWDRIIPSAAEPDGCTKLILVTAHRRENFGLPLENICRALRELAARYSGAVRFVYPVHPNPQVWEPAHRLLEGDPNVVLIPPLDYLPLIHLMQRCHLVLTDSGGIQEEAPGLGIPVLVLRDVTERPEAIEAGTVRLVGTDVDRIVAETARLLDDRDAYGAMARAVNPYGDGHAAKRIVAVLLEEEIEPWCASASS